MSKGEAPAHTWLWPQPLLPQAQRPLPMLPKVITASMPWRKTWLVFTSNPALSPKALGTHRLYRMLLHKDTPSRPQQVTLSPNLTKQRNLRKWENRGVCSLKEQEKIPEKKKQLMRQKKTILTDEKFKPVVIRMLTELGKRIHEHRILTKYYKV